MGRIYLLSNGPEASAPGEMPVREMQSSGAAQAKFVICNQTIEYGFKQVKDELGWADDRGTEYAAIERWWELVMSADTLVSLQSADVAARGLLAPAPLEAHPAWDKGSGWKHHLNNLRLLLQPYVCSCLLLPWLALVPLPHVQAVQTGLAALGSLVNTFRLALPT
jgi:hypothetical protein